MLSVSHTSRKPRQGEKTVRYHFINESEFQQRIEAQDFTVSMKFLGFYGTLKQAINENLARFKCASRYRLARRTTNQKASQKCCKHLHPSPSIKELYTLKSRNLDTLDVIDRMKEAVDEMSHYNEYDYIIVNKDLDIYTYRVYLVFTAEIEKRKKKNIKS